MIYQKMIAKEVLGKTKLRRGSDAPPGPSISSAILISYSSHCRCFSKKTIDQDVMPMPRAHKESPYVITSTVESNKNMNLDVNKKKRKVDAYPDDLTRLKKVKGMAEGDGRGR